MLTSAIDSAKSTQRMLLEPPKMASLTSVVVKKPLEKPVSSSLPQPSNKKRKVSFNLLDESMEQLGDILCVSGVNIKEEYEQLFYAPNFEVSLKSEHVEDQKLILNKTPLHNKLAEIMAKFGLKSKGDNVEQCLSLAIEERLRRLIDNIIRFSKQRVDGEKSRHNVIITSDIKLQIMALNQKAKNEREKKLAEQEKVPKMPEKSGILAANVALRAAVGLEDWISKWKLMAEQKCQAVTNMTKKRDSVPTKTILPLTTRIVTVKDVVSLLETEPQMRKSAFMYRLYEKTRSTATKKIEKM